MTVVVFKSKAEVFSFLDDAMSVGINGKIVSTPKEIKIGCGLAVSIGNYQYARAINIIKNGDYNTFYGIFSVKRSGLKSSLSRLY